MDGLLVVAEVECGDYCIAFRLKARKVASLFSSNPTQFHFLGARIRSSSLLSSGALQMSLTSKYLKGDLLGEGTWGSVFSAERRADSTRVAIKRIKPMYVHLGVNFTALREIKYLRYIKGPNIIDLLDVFISDGVLHLVLEFCPYDLERLIRDKTIFLQSTHVKSYMQMMLRGIECCHKNYVLHRDLKPANLLFGRDGQMKLADFGLARGHSSPEKMTSEVVTRWYRSPELLFGAPLYSTGVDMWAAGCIFAEIVFRVPLFPGDSDLEQLGRIFNVLGTPTAQSWPRASLLPSYVEFEPREAMNLAELFSRSHAAELDLLRGLLALDPARRLTATQALQHEYFNTLPAPCPLDQLPLPAGVAPVVKLQPVVSVASISAGTSTNSLTEGVKSKVQGLDIGKREDEPAYKKVRNF